MWGKKQKKKKNVLHNLHNVLHVIFILLLFIYHIYNSPIKCTKKKKNVTNQEYNLTKESKTHRQGPLAGSVR